MEQPTSVTLSLPFSPVDDCSLVDRLFHGSSDAAVPQLVSPEPDMVAVIDVVMCQLNIFSFNLLAVDLIPT